LKERLAYCGLLKYSKTYKTGYLPYEKTVFDIRHTNPKNGCLKGKATTITAQEVCKKFFRLPKRKQVLQRR
jgi:hypothetical protein